MPTAKKLPSGSWRVRVYSHTDKNGKKVCESFTAPTKREAELKAAEFANRKDRKNKTDLTVYEAIKGYIDAKEGVLSPSTIRAYRTQLRNNYKSIENIPIKKLDTERLQIFVSSLTDSVSSKSVSNIYGLLSSSLRFYMPNTQFNVTLPKKTKSRKFAPSDKEVQALYNSAPPELKKCIAIGAFTGMRRGEICALTFGDIKGNIIHVTKDIVQGSDNKWHLKDMPKTEDSCRDCYVPKKVLDLIGTGEKEENIINYKNPTSVTRVFTRIRDRLGINICFHDLRHYYATIGAVLGVPQSFLEKMGGWAKGSNTMQRVYQGTTEELENEYNRKMADHFNGLL